MGGKTVGHNTLGKRIEIEGNNKSFFDKTILNEAQCIYYYYIVYYV